MVDGQGQQRSSGLSRPVRGEVQQGDRVAAAGQGQGQGSVEAAFEAGVQPGADPAGPVSGGGGAIYRRGAGQANWVRRPAARVRKAALPPAA